MKHPPMVGAAAFESVCRERDELKKRVEELSHQCEKSPAAVAYRTVTEVMNRNRDAHIAAGDLWEERSPDYHLEHALHHLENASIVAAGWGEDHLEHALCRLAMALVVRPYLPNGSKK